MNRRFVAARLVTSARFGCSRAGVECRLRIDRTMRDTRSDRDGLRTFFDLIQLSFDALRETASR
ncbi:hypothetical protein WS70_05880 [Burkholderia mayonis]|uniref:Uncharacterized protein n=1 Tax=Burkholderia mayonis TaxID=1385591 RepID=A0A1B4FCL9_9BURK|nr:hypothetical protein WS70_05880 [Burkholderia mayonis]KVE34795.1 hypothetical protein WS69_16025 [Burkholderia sp. BDU5]KVE49096.1 hypothetical protein WS70_20945 [Burkholderia mayonis]